MPQNIIKKTPVTELGYGFVTKNYLQPNEDEYTLRNMQNKSGINYRKLTAYEIEALVRNRNTSDDWNSIFVSEAFNPELVKNCKFYGLVRIGKLEAFYLGFSDIKAAVGLYNSTIISCDFGDNICIDNVNYLSHFIIGNEVIVMNVNELVTTNHAKFGNGIVKDGESETVRIQLEVCNENGGRSIMPFNRMLPGDAYLWSKYRDDDALLEKFKQFTEAKYNSKRGYYGKIGNRTVIKNSGIIKDCWIGEDAYIKGANKLKNITINSGEKGRTQIGEGVEMVNGIIGFGCTIFYGVKAVRFVMASFSQLKYGARLINSYLGNNATISCCEVLNSLIFPAHEQHHNNSFLCAALIMGQSNIAAGATIGSNHNSRAADGEIIAGRGFWPGLCVSLKHNSQFASFTILAKGDYPNELNIAIPFSLVSNDVANNCLSIMPAYWFMYNMYALERNSWKHIDRDKRFEKVQKIDYHYLAPDTINELFTSLTIIEEAVGRAFLTSQNNTQLYSNTESIKIGKQLLQGNNLEINNLEVIVDGVENSKRKTIIVKSLPAYQLFVELISYYATIQIIQIINRENITSIKAIVDALPTVLERHYWLNIGGQLLPAKDVEYLKTAIKNGDIIGWDAVHDWYKQQGNLYETKKLHHAVACLATIKNWDIKQITSTQLSSLLNEAITTKEWMVKGIYSARAKDYANPFKQMVYDTNEEMNKVIGKLEDNSFIIEQNQDLKQFKHNVFAIKNKLQLG
ncbi:MAG: DUF4954 family protein [Deinococcales bacterium]|nr:DUF4954 family protein [Chitinophagaceae bacterium]